MLSGRHQQFSSGSSDLTDFHLVASSDQPCLRRHCRSACHVISSGNSEGIFSTSLHAPLHPCTRANRPGLGRGVVGSKPGPVSCLSWVSSGANSQRLVTTVTTLPRAGSCPSSTLDLVSGQQIRLFYHADQALVVVIHWSRPAASACRLADLGQTLGRDNNGTSFLK